MRALVLLLLGLSGCATHHTNDQRIAAAADFAVPERALTGPVPPASCTDTSFVELVPPGGVDVRYASLAPLEDGLFVTYEDLGLGTFTDGSLGGERSLAGPLAAWRTEPLWSVDVGHLTSPTADVAATLEAGGDGLLAACAEHEFAWDGSELRPGGVAFFRPDGTVERRVPFVWECADVAFVGGHWVAIEVGESVVTERERFLVVFDGALAPIARVPLGLAAGSFFDERVIDVEGRAVVAIRRDPASPFEAWELALVSVDVEAAAVVADRLLPVRVWPNDGVPRFDLAARGDRIHVVATDGLGDPTWIELDASLEVSRDPVVIEDVGDDASQVDVEVLPAGLVVGWSEDDWPRFSPLELALLDDGSGAITRVETGIPAPQASILGDWIDIAVSGDFVAISILLSDATAGELTNWIWGGRCAAR